jgi:dTDP-4-dehydrorhamnose reductase
MRILLVGSSGLLGHELKKVFSDFDTIMLDKDDLNITDKDAVLARVRKENPDIIINAAGYTKVDDAESERDLAMQVNGYAVGYIAEAANNVGAVLAHYSTDYVFDGLKKEGYAENDELAEMPTSVYGQSKLLGERELCQRHDKIYLIRTSWLFGENGSDFIDTVMRLTLKNGKMRIVADQHGKPTYAADLAKATRELLLFSGEYNHGIYHLVNEIPTTWYEYAKTIVALWGARENWDKNDYPEIIPINSAEFPAKAKRPAYSILLNTKFPILRPWQEALAEYLQSV